MERGKKGTTKREYSIEFILFPSKDLIFVEIYTLTIKRLRVFVNVNQE